MPKDRQERPPTETNGTNAANGAAGGTAASAGATSTLLPRPELTITPLKQGIPAEGGTLELLVTTQVDFPEVSVDRKPLNLALVIDRSGSMSGAPLEGAKEAARTAVSMLMPGDWVSVVTFDDQVHTPVPLIRVSQDREAIYSAISAIRAGGTTALFAGWAEGLSQVLACPEDEVLSRVILLSDGMANHGVTDPGAIATDVSQAVAHQVTTTSMGLGRNYDELLLRTLADAGNGNYVFIEDAAAIVPAFEQELAGIGALRGRNVRLAALPGSGLRIERSRFAPAPAGEVANLAGVGLPVLVAGLPTEHLVVATFEPGAQALELVLTWDDVVTGSSDREVVRLELPALSAEEFAALKTDKVVESYRQALELARLKDRISHASRAGDVNAAKLLITEAKNLVTAMQPGPLRTQEEAELEELDRRIARHDFAMASRQAEKFSRDRFRGLNDEKRLAQFRLEEQLRKSKMAAVLASQEWQKKTIAAAAPETTPSPVDGGTPQASRAQAAAPSALQAAGNLLFEVQLTGPRDSTTTLQVVLGDITEQHVDAIVSSTNRGLFSTAGVAGAIAKGAGPALGNALRGLEPLDYGSAVFTPGFALPATYVIHTATTPWGTTGRELDTLAQCYQAVFALAERLSARTVALPAIGAGIYQYPAAAAAGVAIGQALDWLRAHGGLDLVRFVVFENATAQAYVQEIERLTSVA